MPRKRRKKLRAAQQIALELLADQAGFAIMLAERSSEDSIEIVLPPTTRQEDYCNILSSNPQTAGLCDKDHRDRAKRLLNGSGKEVMPCYAGLLNKASPIRINGEIRSVLIYGQMSADGTQWEDDAGQRHESLFERFEFSEDDEIYLRVAYEAAKRYPEDDFATVCEPLCQLQKLFYELLSDQDEMDTQFLRITHDLHTRLQPLMNQVENVHRGLVAADMQSEHRESLIISTERLIGACNGLRVKLWNLGDYMAEYDFQMTRVCELFESAIDTYVGEADSKYIDIYTHVGMNDEIYLSRDHLQQAIDNLLNNSIKYSYRGAPDKRKYIEFWGEYNGRRYEIGLKNYGVGILPHEIHRVFEAGYQGSLTRGEYRVGTGLGLNIAHEIVKAHGGEMNITSRPAGVSAYVTTVMISLPTIQPRHN